MLPGSNGSSAFCPFGAPTTPEGLYCARGAETIVRDVNLAWRKRIRTGLFDNKRAPLASFSRRKRNFDSSANELLAAFRVTRAVGS